MPDFPELFAASWGKIQLFCSSIQSDNSRTKVVHDLTSGDVHPVQDRGLRARRTRVALQFDNFPGQPSPEAQARAFKAEVDRDAIALFTHPLDGAFLASVGEFIQQIDNGTVLSATCEFIPEEELLAVTPAGPATGGAGSGAVTAAADELDDAMIAAFGEGPVGPDQDRRRPVDPYANVTDDARASADAWDNEDPDAPVPTRQVLIDQARIEAGLEQLGQDAGFETDLDLWACFVAAQLLMATVRAAAESATSEVSSVFIVRVPQPTSLLALAARIYGGAEAQERARQIVDLNDIATPGWLDPGDYLMPTRTATRRAPF